MMMQLFLAEEKKTKAVGKRTWVPYHAQPNDRTWIRNSSPCHLRAFPPTIGPGVSRCKTIVLVPTWASHARSSQTDLGVRWIAGSVVYSYQRGLVAPRHSKRELRVWTDGHDAVVDSPDEVSVTGKEARRRRSWPLAVGQMKSRKECNYTPRPLVAPKTRESSGPV